MPVSDPDVSRPRLIRDGSFLVDDWREIAQRRRVHNRLGFLLQYMSEPQLRTRVRRGLLKVEQLHALARAVYYGQRGRISAREVYDQMNACSCLTLILACIIYWQAREISRIAAAPDFPLDPELIARISPIEWKNVILYGEIKIDADKLRIRGR